MFESERKGNFCILDGIVRFYIKEKYYVLEDNFVLLIYWIRGLRSIFLIFFMCSFFYG